jgi:hypothetical protein
LILQTKVVEAFKPSFQYKVNAFVSSVSLIVQIYQSAQQRSRTIKLGDVYQQSNQFWEKTFDSLAAPIVDFLTRLDI